MDLMRPHAAAIEEKVSSGCFVLSAGVTRVRSGDGAVGWELEGRQEAGMKNRIHPQQCIRSFTQCLPSAYHTPGSGTIHTKLGLLVNSPYVQTHSSSIHVCTGVKAYTLMFMCTYTHKSKIKSFQKSKRSKHVWQEAKVELIQLTGYSTPVPYDSTPTSCIDQPGLALCWVLP